jgi:hypothetical protein
VILTHPDGPSEFPLEQIVANGWHRRGGCPVPGVFFPQIPGNKFRDLACPERCGRKPFAELNGSGGATELRQHLRIMHKWDPATIQAYGERVGIDFEAISTEGQPLVVSYDGDDYQAEAAAPVATCPACGEGFSGKMAKAHLGQHLRRCEAAQAVVETVGA